MCVCVCVFFINSFFWNNNKKKFVALLYDLSGIVCTLFNFPSDCVQSQKFRLISLKFSYKTLSGWKRQQKRYNCMEFRSHTAKDPHGIANQTNTFSFDRWWFHSGYNVSNIPFVYRIHGNSVFSCAEVWRYDKSKRGKWEQEREWKRIQFFFWLNNNFEWITFWLPTLFWHHFLALFNSLIVSIWMMNEIYMRIEFIFNIRNK